jgi:xanthine dehydrogenase accessory factor
MSREQAWSDAPVERGRVVVVTDNPIGRAVVAIAQVAGRETVLLPDDGPAPSPQRWLEAHPPSPADAVVLCDHDTPGMEALLRAALDSPAGYVAMLGSRRRAESVLSWLAEAAPAQAVAKLRIPAGLDLGGRGPGEIALSVVAELVAHSYGRPGGSLRP